MYEILAKILRVMKLTVFLLFLALTQVCAEGYSQSITYKGKNITLKQVFNEINKQTGYNVFWSSGIIAGAPRMDVNFENTPLRVVLETCLQRAHLTYSIEEKSIIIQAGIRARDIIEPRAVEAADLHVLDRFGLNGKIGGLRPSDRNETRC